MKYHFYIQDPTSPTPHYLIEAIIEQLSLEATSLWRGLFAFASKSGIEGLLGDIAVKSFLNRGEIELIIGIDAITNPSALQKLKELEDEYKNFSVRVYYKQMQGIFHPKVAHFIRENGSQVLIVGSGNLTQGGLKNNIEAYSIFISEPGEGIEFDEIEKFLYIHSKSLREIDEEIFEIARQNKVFRKKGRRIVEEVEPEEVLDEEEVIEIAPIEENSRVLIAEVPKAGYRWHQIHFNIDINKQFFRVQPNSSERAYLFEKVSPTQIGPEEIRPCVFSGKNRNIRIEFAGKRGRAYPEKGRPILVVREIGTRIFHYILLMPDDIGYEEIQRFIEKQKPIGRGVRRIITTCEELKYSWDKCPV